MNAFPGVWVFSCSVLIPSTLTSWRYFGWGQGSRYKNNRSRMKLPKLPMTQITQISKGENGSFLMSFYKLEVTGNLIPMPTLKDSSTKNHLRKHISPFQTIYHSLPTSRCLFLPGEYKAGRLYLFFSSLLLIIYTWSNWSLRAFHFMVINLRT